MWNDGPIGLIFLVSAYTYYAAGVCEAEYGCNGLSSEDMGTYGAHTLTSTTTGPELAKTIVVFYSPSRLMDPSIIGSSHASSRAYALYGSIAHVYCLIINRTM